MSNEVTSATSNMYSGSLQYPLALSTNNYHFILPPFRVTLPPVRPAGPVLPLTTHKCCHLVDTTLPPLADPTDKQLKGEFNFCSAISLAFEYRYLRVPKRFKWSLANAARLNSLIRNQSVSRQ